MKIVKWKYGLLTILLGIILTVRTFPVYAAEAEPVSPSDKEVMEGEKKGGRVQVIFQIGCLDGFKEDVYVEIYDASNLKKELEVILTSANGYTAENKTLEPNKSYAVTVDCKNKDTWSITNADGSAITKYDVGENALKLSWQIEKKEKKESASKEEAITDPKTSAEDMGEMTKDYGEKLVEDFMKEFNYLESDSSFQTTINRYTTDKCKKDFLDCANSRGVDANIYTEKKWDSCSEFEKTMYMLLFVRPNNILLGANSADYATTKEDFVEYIGLFAGLDGAEEYADKIISIWGWQYDYYKVTGRVEDFFQNMKIEEDSSEVNQEEKEDSKKEQISKTPEKNSADVDDKNKDAKERRKELSSKENYLSIINENIVSILLVLISAGILLFLYIRKRKNNKIKKK